MPEVFLHDDVSRQLQDSRAELRAFLGYESDAEGQFEMPREFPRSRLMRNLTSGRVAAGFLLVGAIVLALNPRFGVALLRKAPVQLLASRLLARVL